MVKIQKLLGALPSFSFNRRGFRIMNTLVSLLLSTTVSFLWLPNSEADLDGYKIYYGYQPGSYEQVVDVGNVTEYSMVISAESKFLYAAVTAYDTAGNESGFSDEVSTYLEAKNIPAKAVLKFFDASQEPEIDKSQWENRADNRFDVSVDAQFVHWGELNGWHRYTYNYTGTGTNLILRIHDSYYQDNSGSLEFTIMRGDTLLWSDYIDSRVGLWLSPQPLREGSINTINIQGKWRYWNTHPELEADAEYSKKNPY